MLHAELVKEGQHLELSGLEGPELMNFLVSVGVGGTGIQEGGDLIERVTGSKTAVVTESSMGTHEVHAPLVVAAVESVVLWDLNRQAVTVLGAITALGSLLGLLILDLSGEGDVVINVLSPGDKQHGDGMIVRLVTVVHVGGHQTGRGQGIAGGGNSTGRGKEKQKVA